MPQNTSPAWPEVTDKNQKWLLVASEGWAWGLWTVKATEAGPGHKGPPHPVHLG